MNEKLKNTMTTVKEKWSGTSKMAKVLLIAVPIAIIAIIIVIVVLLNQKGHAVLFSGVNSAEAGEIAALIVDEYKITDVTVEKDGDIIVPEDQVDYLRMQMYMKGYPSSSTDYEIWNTGIDLWSTDPDKREVKRQQLETRIGAALTTLDDIRTATVTLVLPETSDYVITTDKGVSSCSVILELYEGEALTNDEVRAIYRAVTTSAENLTNDNVSILDTTGKMYAWVDPEDDKASEVDASGVQVAERRLRFQKEFEDQLAEGLGDMFNKVYGEKNYAFNVTAILNYDQVAIESEEFIPVEGTDHGVVTIDKEVTEGGSLNTNGDVVGTTPNADESPDYPEFIGLEDGQNYYYSSDENQYSVSNIKKSLLKDGYEIEKLSVALMINQTNMVEAEREALCDIVAKASGADIANVSVYAIPFTLQGSGSGGTTIGDGNSGFKVITPEDTYRDMLLFVVIGLGALLIILLIVSLFMSGSRKKKIRRRQEAALAAAGGSYETMATSQSPEPIEEVDFNIASLTEEAGKDSKETILKREISEFAKTNPDIVASIIKNMLREE